MNTLRQFAVLLVTVAIGLSSCQKAVGKVTPVKSDFTFLKKLGIETTGGIVLPDSIDREHIDSRHDAAFMLDFDKQAVPLLDEVLGPARRHELHTGHQGVARLFHAGGL